MTEQWKAITTQKITSLHKGAACPKNTLNMQRRVSHGYACMDTLPS